MIQKSPTRTLLTYFDACHRATFDVPAVIHGGKDAKLLAALWKSHPDHVQPLMSRFFAERGEWAEKCGYSVGVFVSQFARLLLQHQKDERRELRVRPGRKLGPGDPGYYEACEAARERYRNEL